MVSADISVAASAVSAASITHCRSRDVAAFAAHGTSLRPLPMASRLARASRMVPKRRRTTSHECVEPFDFAIPPVGRASSGKRQELTRAPPSSRCPYVRPPTLRQTVGPRATLNRTGICHFRLCCCAATGIAVDDGVTICPFRKSVVRPSRLPFQGQKRVIGSELSPNADAELGFGMTRAKFTPNADATLIFNTCSEYGIEPWQTGSGMDF